MEVFCSAKKRIDIQSIGTADPGVAKILADAFSLPEDLILRLLYTAPSTLFNDVDEELATETKRLLKELGLEVSLKDAADPKLSPTELFEISVSLPEIKALPKVTAQLAKFIGASHNTALSLLTREPGVVLGGVSKATAEAFASRIEAEVKVSNPKQDLYTLLSKKVDALTRAQLEKDHSFSRPYGAYQLVIKDLNYEAAQKVWKRLQGVDSTYLINQSHLRYSLVLKEADPANLEQREVLHTETGIPEEILDTVMANLPVQLYDSLEVAQARDVKSRLERTGLKIEAQPEYPRSCFVTVSGIESHTAFEVLLAPFFGDQKPTIKKGTWTSAVALPGRLANYLAAQLEDHDYNTEIIPEYAE